jgi:hypothetical protein
MAIGLGCGVGGTKPPIRRAALLAKQSPGDGTVDLAKQSHRKAQAVLAEQSQREARVGFGGAEPSLHLSPRGPSGERCRGRPGFGETKPTGGVAWIWRNKPNAAAQIRRLDQKTAEKSKCCTTDHAPGTDESAGSRITPRLPNALRNALRRAAPNSISPTTCRILTNTSRLNARIRAGSAFEACGLWNYSCAIATMRPSRSPVASVGWFRCRGSN